MKFEKEKEMEMNEETKIETGAGEHGKTTEANDEVHETESADGTARMRRPMLAWVATVVVAILLAIAGGVWMSGKRAATDNAVTASEKNEKNEGGGEHENESGREVRIDPASLEKAGITTEGATVRQAVAKLYVTGSVELNPERTEMATPLVGGRIESVAYGVGDFVRKGAVLAVVSSPQVAQLHGKMHEAKTRYELARRNAERVRKTENRVAVLQSKARLDEAEKSLARTRRLIELGAGAGKDLVSAETNYRTAKADYDFQTNIGLNKEIQEAAAEVETARVDLHHIEDEMRSLGVEVDAERDESGDHAGEDTSRVVVRSPLSGIVTERRFNAGAGIEAATPIFAVSDLSSVYVIANVPAAYMTRLAVGSYAEIKSEAIGSINGRVGYIDPKLDEATRTGRVRVEVANPAGRLRAGMFTEVGFISGGGGDAGDDELVVPSAAVQRTAGGSKTVVFIPRPDEPGAYEVREIETGADAGDGYVRVLSGLKLGEAVVTGGSFVLKTQLEKGVLGDED